MAQTAETAENYEMFKADVIACLKRDAEEVNNHIKMHMYNLQQFIKTEFHKMDAQMDDKWDLLFSASTTLTKDGVDSQSVGRESNSRNPVILE